MTENIEMYSYPVHKDDDIEVYHESVQDFNPGTATTTLSSNTLADPISGYDFFTIQQPKRILKKSEKRKKSKKKEKSQNIMDIVCNELASFSVPISENNIEVLETNSYDFRDIFICFARDLRLTQRRSSYFELKNRFYNSQTVHLHPVFLDIQEPSVNETQDSLFVGYVEPAMFKDVIAAYSDADEEHSSKFLNVELKNIKFKHHHKFSLENLLCVKLIEQYHEYENIKQSLKVLSRNIQVSRETKNNLKTDLLTVSPKKREDLRFDATVRKYTGQLLQLKEEYIKLFREHKSSIHNVLSIWSDIEMVRDKFQRRDTSYDLYIKKYSLSDDAFEKEWNEIYKVEFSDMIDKLEYEFVTKYLEYKEAKSDQRFEHGSKKKPNKPKLNVDEDELKVEVEQLVNYLILREKTDLTLIKLENWLYDKTSNYYHFEIYVDNTFVCQSEEYKCDNEILSAYFTESFSVEILPRNESLTILLFENDVEVANAQVNFSDVRNEIANGEYLKVEFKYSNIEPTKLNNVGSGCSIKEIAAFNKVRLKSSNMFKECLVTTCNVLMRMGWRESLNEMEAIRDSMETGRILQRLMHGIDKPNIETLTDIIEKVYGKDVTNDQTMINTILRLCKLRTKVEDKFPMNENAPESVRLKLLYLRNSGGFINVENKMVPIHGSQITTEQLNCLQRTKEKDIDIDYLKSKEADMDRIELQRFIAAKYIQKLNKNVMKNLNDHLMVKTQKDVVREYQNFSFRALFTKQGNAASLAPISSNTKQQILTDSLSQKQDIYVTVVRAFNLVDRSTTITEDSDNDADVIAGFKVRPLRPFVKISYHGVNAQTVTAMGCHPTWNHTLKISSKFNPLSSILINIYDEYKENIKESEINEDLSSKTVHYRYYRRWIGTAQVPLYTVLGLGALHGTFKLVTPPLLFGYETLQSKESSSLIPEITQLIKKDISFITLHITTSLSHLGGFKAYNQPLPSTVEDDYIIKHLNAFVTNYTNNFPNRNISLTFIDSAGRNKCVTQFLQPIPMPNREYFPKNPKTCGSALSKSSGHSRSSSSKSSGRKRDVDFEASVERESVYSQGSWKGGDNLGKMINSCLRYVALIPSYEVTESHAVTLTGLEILKLLHGTPLDHSILLASYFLYIGVKSWVAIGLGIPRGRSSYVIISYDLTFRRYVLTTDDRRSRGFLRGDGYMWLVCDAVSGERSEVRDVACPMKTVDYVFDSENIWVNVQSSQECESVLFDFSKSSDWQPVFDKSIFVMKQPIVNDSNLYSSPSEVEPLRQSLETKIRGKVQKWRPHTKTIWNRYCSGLLRDALPCWEYWTFNSNENKPSFSHKFKQLMVTYKVFGFPFNMPFVSTKSVISAVKSTGLHLNDDPNLEFGLAVEVYAYPNNVLSVWVFLASISRV